MTDDPRLFCDFDGAEAGTIEQTLTDWHEAANYFKKGGMVNRQDFIIKGDGCTKILCKDDARVSVCNDVSFYFLRAIG